MTDHWFGSGERSALARRLGARGWVLAICVSLGAGCGTAAPPNGAGDGEGAGSATGDPAPSTGAADPGGTLDERPSDIIEPAPQQGPGSVWGEDGAGVQAPGCQSDYLEFDCGAGGAYDETEY